MMKVRDLRNDQVLVVYKIWQDMKRRITRFLIYDWYAQAWFWDEAVYYQPVEEGDV